MKITEKYPELAGFLVGWFAERDLDGATSFEDCVARFTENASREDISDVVAEGEQFLSEDHASLNQIRSLANIHFPAVGETPEGWLKRILSLLKAKL